jgi:hypothetical protein
VRRLMLALSLLCAAGCGMSEEAAAAKDRESSKTTWAMVLKIDGADVRIPLKAMNVLLFKDEEYAKQNPSVFQIEGNGVHLIGEIAAAGQYRGPRSRPRQRPYAGAARSAGSDDASRWGNTSTSRSLRRRQRLAAKGQRWRWRSATETAGT